MPDTIIGHFYAAKKKLLTNYYLIVPNSFDQLMVYVINQAVIFVLELSKDCFYSPFFFLFAFCGSYLILSYLLYLLLILLAYP